MVLLEELWMDGNQLTSIPAFIGALSNLVHLDLSLNQEQISVYSVYLDNLVFSLLEVTMVKNPQFFNEKE